MQGDWELVGVLSLADIARETRREATQVENPAISVRAIGDTVAVISEARNGGGAIVAT